MFIQQFIILYVQRILSSVLSSMINLFLKIFSMMQETAGRSCFDRCLSVILFRGVPMWPLAMMHWEMGSSLYPWIPDMRPTPSPIPPPRTPWIPDMGPTPSPAADIWWSSLETCSNLFAWGPTPPPVLISSGGHWNTYSWQAGGTHPTGMLSCITKSFGFSPPFKIF